MAKTSNGGPIQNPADEIDYNSIEVPENQDPEDYHYTTRRAEILQIIKSRGNPYSIKKVDLADRYDVDPSIITRDFHRLRDFIHEHLGDNAKVTARSAMERAVVEEQQDDNYAKAFYIALDWAKFLQSVGEMETAPMRAEVTHKEADTTGEEYSVVTDEDPDDFIEVSSSAETTDDVAELADGGDAEHD